MSPTEKSPRSVKVDPLGFVLVIPLLLNLTPVKEAREDF